MKTCQQHFPHWTDRHQSTFQAIKSLVISPSYLTSINHDNPGNNHIFLTTDTSDFRLGAMLFWGLSRETARPVAFDSMQFHGVELNYPVHKKELLAIVRALKKWRVELLGAPITIFTDHCMLENFATQCDLSRCQACWAEFMSQYNLTIEHIKGEDNLAADALSRLPREFSTTPSLLVASVLSISADLVLLQQIKDSYANDPFCVKLLSSLNSVPGLTL